MKATTSLHRRCIACSIALVLLMPCVRAAEELPPAETKRLLKEIPVAYEGMFLAVATYKINYEFKAEILEGCKAYAEAMRNHSEYRRGPLEIPKGGRRILAEEWIPRAFSCELVGTPTQHKLTYQCLLNNSYDLLPVGAVSTQLRSGDECIEYYPNLKAGRKESISFRLAPSYLALLHHLPSDIPYMKKSGSWGTGKESSITDLFNKAMGDSEHYRVTAMKQDNVIRMNILRTFVPDQTSAPGAGIIWTVEVDAGKNFAPLLVSLRPGRDVDGRFTEYGYGDSITYSGYQEPSPGIWMPSQITAEAEGRLRSFVEPGEDTSAWNKGNAPLDAILRISRFTINATKIEVNVPVNADELTPTSKGDAPAP